jgi:hypothetical protein
VLLSLDKLKTEFKFSYDYQHWEKMYLESRPLSNPTSVTLGVQQSTNSAAAAGSNVSSDVEVALTGKRLSTRPTTKQKARCNVVASSRIAPSGMGSGGSFAISAVRLLPDRPMPFRVVAPATANAKRLSKSAIERSIAPHDSVR